MKCFTQFKLINVTEKKIVYLPEEDQKMWSKRGKYPLLSV